MDSPTIFANLRSILAELYPDESGTRRLVADAGLNTIRIEFSSRAVDNWHSILTEATKTGKIKDLLAVSSEEYSANKVLFKAWAEYRLLLEHGIDPLSDDRLPGEPPYKGMQYFDQQDAHLFFGREQLTAQLVAHLRAHRLLAVVGASGSGKSSVVRAGLIPALQRGLLIDGPPQRGSVHWPVHVITPTAHPLKALAASLTRNSDSDLERARLIDELAQDRRVLDLRVARLLTGSATQLLLVVDQFEELFTLCRDAQERQHFVDNLLTAAVADGATTVVLTLRADFYHRCADFAELRSALEQHQRYIGPMSGAELRHAIEEPARLGSWELEPGLVDLLLDDVAAEPGALPLLSHALLETWKRRRGHQLTLAGYAASGRVQGAIAQTAEAVLNQTLSNEQRAIARNIFVRLTELGEGVQDTRRRVALAELIQIDDRAEIVEKVIQALADARLITTDHDQVEVAHEALIREWATLREWLADNREGLRIHRRLTEAAQGWELNRNDKSDLLRGIRLSQAQEWAISHTADLNQMEQAFLQASQAEAEAQILREAALNAEREANRQRELENQRQLAGEQKRRASIFRNAVMIAVLLMFLSTVAAGIAIYLNMQLNDIINQRDQTVKDLDSANNQLQNAVVETKRLANITLSRRLAAQSISELSKYHYELAILLAIESERVTDTLESASALHAVTANPWHSSNVLYGHKDLVYLAEWNQDETKILTTGIDYTARIWDADAGEELIRLDDAVSAEWNQDETKILTTSDDGTVHILYTEIAHLLDVACSWTPRNLTQPEWDAYLQGNYRPTCPHALIPPDVIVAIKDKSSDQIRAGQVVSSVQQLEQLNGWLQVNGQLENFGVNAQTFVAEVSATATAMSLPAVTPVPNLTSTWP